MPSALRLVEAMKRVHVLKAIGHCPTKFLERGKHMIYYGPDDLTQDHVERQLKLTEEMREREQHNMVRVELRIRVIIRCSASS